MFSKIDTDLPAGNKIVAANPIPWSLATRLTFWYFLLSFLMVLVSTVFLYRSLVDSLDQDHDGHLADKIRIIRLLIERNQTNQLRWEITGEIEPSKHREISLRVIDMLSGTRMESPGMSKILPFEGFEQKRDAFSADILEESPQTHTPSMAFWGHTPHRGDSFLASDGREFRLSRSLFQKNGKHQIIHAAIDTTEDRLLLASFRGKMAFIITISLFLCAFTGYWIARQGIKPIFHITDTAAKVHSSTLHDRISTVGLPLELHDLADTMNAMLTRLEESFHRLTQFSADIAHELRTPAHNLRGLVEVALITNSTPEETRELLVPCLDECRRLSTMIDNLLFLAKAENPRTIIDLRLLNIKQELNTIWEYYEAAAAEKNITLSFQSEDGLDFQADRMLFQRALGNLIENAMKYTPAKGTIFMRAFRREEAIAIEVTDTGCGLPPEHLPFLFDRLYRAEFSRKNSAKGAGLGLAIVKGIASLHGGSISVNSVVGVETTFTLIFPKRG